MTRKSVEVMSLAKYVEETGLCAAARALGCKPPSVQKALNRKRDILVAIYANGNVVATETKSFPSN